MIDKFDGTEYGFLSNFHPCLIRYEGLCYDSTESAFQAQKTFNKKARKAISTLNAAYSKAIGGALQLRPDWEEVKVKVMDDVLHIKFAPGSDLAKRLLATGDEELVEGNTWGDKFWGVCDGVGKNYLGKLLMKIREELKNGNRGTT